MALTERTEFQSITILADGQIQVRRDRVIMDGTEEIGRRPHRFVLEPGQDVSQFPPRLQRVTEAVWTAQVIEDFQESRRQQAGPLIRDVAREIIAESKGIAKEPLG